ncbi:MAG: hypothetical protein HYS39_03505 [Proteobacteria bacterium]|nr:hypothetical protein [Pseudomonadota bacterium]
MMDMLEGVILRGTATKLKPLLTKYGFSLAGKTGTTNNYKDAWFIGTGKGIVVGVFVGFLNPRTLGEGETGGRVAVPIFYHFMDLYLNHR